MGPQHPSTHGVFRMVATLDGEQIVKLKPVFGYLHRNHEKIAESTQLPRVDALHRPARLPLLDDHQLGLRARRSRNLPGQAVARARRVSCASSSPSSPAC